MEPNRNVYKQESNEAVLDFISGKVDTLAARRLTKGINNIHSLWLLAKMTGNVRYSRNR